MTIPFLRACITTVIANLERKSISDSNKRRALLKPEDPWKWFTSYELGLASPWCRMNMIDKCTPSWRHSRTTN